MTRNIASVIQSTKRTLVFFVNSVHFSTITVTVVAVTAALFFANITPASLPDSRTLVTLNESAADHLARLAAAQQDGEEAGLESEAAARAEQSWPADYQRIEGELARGDNLAAALRRVGLDEALRSQVITGLAGLLDFRSLRPGDRFFAILDQDGQLVEFRYQSGPLDIYRLGRLGHDPDQKLQAEKMAVNLERRTKKLAGEVGSSLFAAFQPLGESPRLLYSFADIFSSHIDFNVETRSGDRFQLIFEKYYQGEQFVGYGRIISARYEMAAGEVYEAFRYESAETPVSYFDREGNELGASFLRSPVPMARVSSGFTYRRLHPILNVVRPHLAVDLAAPEGTPVMATADGRVVFRAMNGGNGNMVTIDHGNGYRSSYAHLSGFRRGLKVGDRVRQKDIIGYVGSTGLATGPHVCYRIQHNGQYVNPLALKFKPRSVLAGAELAAFQSHVNDLVRLADDLGRRGRVLQVRQITVEPEDRLVLL